MKILVVQETDWEKRGPHHSHHLFERLAKLGHEIQVIDYDIEWKKRNKKKIISKRKIIQAKPKMFQETKIKVIKPKFMMIKGLDLISIGFTQFIEIFRQIKVFKPDIVVSFGIICGFSSSILCKLYNIPFCEYWMDVLHELIPVSIFKQLGLALEKITIARCDLFIAINSQLLEYGKRFGPSNYTLIRAGVDLKIFVEDNEIRKEKRDRLNIKKDECLLFFMGYLYPFSGLPDVIECILRDSSKYSKFKILIIGDGDQKNDLKQLIEKNNLGNQIFLNPWVPYEEIPGLISAGDICLLPAINNKIMQDIVPIKLYEYLAIGKPVVSTLLPGVVKEFNKGNGVVYAKNPNDVMRVCYAMLEQNLIKKIGNQGRKFIEKNCDWNFITKEFFSELKKLKS